MAAPVRQNVPTSFEGLKITESMANRLSRSLKTGFAYDRRMELHCNLWCEDFPEQPARTRVCYERLQSLALLDKCVKLALDFASIDQLELVHDLTYIDEVSQTAQMNYPQLAQTSAKFNSVFLNQHTWDAARLSVNAAIQLTQMVMSNELKNGLAILRPPGHHAMEAEASGFCIFNNVAIAAKFAQEEMQVKRILIVDWDAHHGQGTQYTFYDDPSVLCFSIHRYENGAVWPHLRESDYDFIGAEKGRYYNINVPLNETCIGNSDYIAIFHNLLLPVAQEFDPQLILISCGFNAAIGCQAGFMEVHPACFGYLTHKLLSLAGGRVVVCLEGGCCLDPLAEGCAYTLRALLDDPLPLLEPLTPPRESVKRSIFDCITLLRTHWKSLCMQGDSELQPLPLLDLNGPTATWDRQLVRSQPLTSSRGHGSLPRHLFAEYAAKREKLVQLLRTTVCPQFQHRTCVAYSGEMLKHFSVDPSHKNHPEKPDRIQRMYHTLIACGLLDVCRHLQGRFATREEILLVHNEEHFQQMENSANLSDEDLIGLSRSYNSVYIMKETFRCALVATGCLLNVVDEVLTNGSRNGVAIIRPPGHHAEANKCMGFSIFNNVAVAARYAQRKHGISRVLIVDWDVHHGNGTQRIFQSDPTVLYMSIHRFDHGAYYPCNPDASHEMTGTAAGEGFTVNIAWNGRKGIGSAEYIAAFHHVILPIAHEFNPQLVLVSAGFDAAQGDVLGRLNVTPECFGHLTHMLGCLAEGRVILVLEGGYNLACISNCMSHCVASLVGYPPSKTKCGPPCDIAVTSIRATMHVHSRYWRCLQFHASLPRFIPMEAGRNNGTSSPDNSAPTTLISTICLRSSGLPPSHDVTGAVNPAAVAASSGVMKDLSELSSRLSHMSVEETPSETESSGSAGPPLLERAYSSSFGDDSRNERCDSEEDLEDKINQDLLPMDVMSSVTPFSFSECGTPSELCSHLGHLHSWSPSCATTSSSSSAYPLWDMSTHSLWPHMAPHLQPDRLHALAPCELCGDEGDNWLCLACAKVLCGRERRKHMLQHHLTHSQGHDLALSWADLSVWCYRCDAYVQHPQLQPFYTLAHLVKFGCLPAPEMMHH